MVYNNEKLILTQFPKRGLESWPACGDGGKFLSKTASEKGSFSIACKVKKGKTSQHVSIEMSDSESAYIFVLVDRGC